MKKIAYLVAPLMVMPFLIGCNNVKTHKVASVLSVDSKLKFTTMKGKDLENSAFNHKQKFKFKVETANEAGLTIDPNGIGIYVGKDAQMPLLDGYTVKYTNESKTAAVVTVEADQVTDDIYIDSIAAKEGYYIYSTPLLIDLKTPAGQFTLGWQKKNEGFDLEFEAVEGATTPTADCFLFTTDAETFHYNGEVGEWMTGHIKFGQGSDKNKVKVSVYANAMKEDENYLLITGRSADSSSFLDALSWDQIKTLADDGMAPALFNVGDTKQITYKTEDGAEIEHTIRIIGFGHDNLTRQTDVKTKASVTFQFADAITDKDSNAVLKQWNGTKQAGNFETSDINKYLKNTVLEGLPEDLKNIIVDVQKKVGKFNSKYESWSPKDYTTKLFLLSVEEIRGNKESLPSYCKYIKEEGTQYRFYQTDAKIAKNNRVISSAGATHNQTYWLRSPNDWEGWIDYAQGVANYINADGTFGSKGCYVDEHEYAIVPAFCI